MSTAPAVDWAAAEREAHRRQWCEFGVVLLVLATVLALDDGIGGWRGGWPWAALAGVVVLFAGLQVAPRWVPRLRAQRSDVLRVQHALRAHVDPGPRLRTKVDLAARRTAGSSRVIWLWPVPVASLLLQGQWHRPLVAVPAAVVLVGLVAALVPYWRGRCRTAGGGWPIHPDLPENSRRSRPGGRGPADGGRS